MSRPGENNAWIWISALTAVFCVPQAGSCVDAQEPPAGGERNADDFSITTAPERVYTCSDVLLRLHRPPRRTTRVAWQVSGGFLLADDLREVSWETPAVAGEVRVTVEVTVGDSANVLREELVIPVHEPSRRGMVLIPAGVYTIGDTWTSFRDPEFVRTNQNMADKPPHRVKLSPFWLDRDRVTNEAYVSFLRAALAEGLVDVTTFAVLGPHRGAMVPYFRFSYDDVDGNLVNYPELRGSISWDGRDFHVRPGHQKHPVVDVTWPGANAYARYYGKRLPTNAEWEAAARGTDNRRFPWGNELPTPKHANVNGYYGGQLLPVGSFPLGASPFGVHDMVGGVFEWVHDWYNSEYYQDIHSPDPIPDPTGPHWGRDHVIRGVPASQGLVGGDYEQPPLSFRYSWFFETPPGGRPLGDGFANAATGFRTAADVRPQERAR